MTSGVISSPGDAPASGSKTGGGGAGAAVPARLRDRLTELGVTVVLIGRDGRMVPQGDGGLLVRLLLASPALTAAVRRLWPTLAADDAAGRAMGVWPGLWLAPLPRGGPARSRRDAIGPNAVSAAVLMGADLLSSEQFQLACDQARVDVRAAAARVDLSRLLTAGEAGRLAAVLAWMGEDAADLDGRTQELSSLSQELADSYEELSLLYKFTGNMTVDGDPRALIADAARELQQTSAVSWLSIQIIDDDPRLKELSGGVFVAGRSGCDIDAMRALGKRLMREVAERSTPRIYDDAPAQVPHMPADLCRHLMVAPLRLEGGKLLGLIVAGDKIDSEQLTSEDAKLCDSLGKGLTIFLENLMLYEDTQDMFLGTLHALTSAIDAKDSYTCGHSERVALMSRQIAEAAGLDEHTIERVYIAGLVHDVGKIGVPEAVLCKPGKLDDAEFALIKQHPEIGARILQDIRQMNDLIPGVLHHHERWDGRGYPHKLAGRNIPLFGRIIALADAFDAMSSNRTYRKSLDHARVLGEIEKNGGTQFDPRLADLFLGLDFAAFNAMLDQHQSKLDEKAAACRV